MASCPKCDVPYRFSLPATMTQKGWEKLRAARAETKKWRDKWASVKKRIEATTRLEREITAVRAAYKQAVTERDQWAEKWEQEYHRSIGRGARTPGLPDAE